MAQSLRHGEIGNPQLSQRFSLRKDSLDHVADNNQIRTGLQIFRSVAFHDINTGLSQKIGHGRIDILIGTGYPIAIVLEHPGHGSHAGSADTHDMDVLNRLHQPVQSLIKTSRHSDLQLTLSRSYKHVHKSLQS